MATKYELLTAKQKKVLLAIESYIKKNGFPPTVREIGEIVGEKTPGAIQGILNRLEQKGAIKREVGMARSIRLITQNENYSKAQYIPEIKKISERNIDNLLSLYNIRRYYPIAEELIEKEKEYFIFKCTDDSLKEKGIKDGDYLLVCKNCEIEDKDIVVVLFGKHVIVREFFKGPGTKLTLMAQGDIFNKKHFSKNEVEILGKIKGRYTKY